MTDNTQELDAILAVFANYENPYEQIYGHEEITIRRIESTKQAIIDWHNKQVESELKSIYGELGNIKAVRECIDDRLAERNKLEESSNDKRRV